MSIDVNALDLLPAEDNEDLDFVCEPTCFFTFPFFGSGTSGEKATPIE